MIRVLIVDDQRLIRRGLAVILADAAFIEIIGEADNGKDAITQVERLQPDVVLMDIRMPGMDGVAATAEICRRFPTVRVLVLTSDDGDAFVARAMGYGAAGYLMKDTPTEELLQAIALVHKGYTHLGPGLGQKLAAQLALNSPPPPETSPATSPCGEKDWQHLTPREREIATLIGSGLNNDEIAGQLCISKSTVKNHITKILQRLNLRDRTQVAILANSV